jgi:hypothetical protein
VLVPHTFRHSAEPCVVHAQRSKHVAQPLQEGDAHCGPNGVLSSLVLGSPLAAQPAPVATNANAVTNIMLASFMIVTFRAKQPVRSSIDSGDALGDRSRALIATSIKRTIVIRCNC